MRRERRLAFGEAADLYDRARPAYPAALATTCWHSRGQGRATGRSRSAPARARRPSCSPRGGSVSPRSSPIGKWPPRRDCAWPPSHGRVRSERLRAMGSRRRSVPSRLLSAGLALDPARRRISPGPSGARRGRGAGRLLEPAAVAGDALPRRARAGNTAAAAGSGFDSHPGPMHPGMRGSTHPG